MNFIFQEQFQFIYEAVIEYLQDFETYSNFQWIVSSMHVRWFFNRSENVVFNLRSDFKLWVEINAVYKDWLVDESEEVCNIIWIPYLYIFFLYYLIYINYITQFCTFEWFIFKNAMSRIYLDTVKRCYVYMCTCIL